MPRSLIRSRRRTLPPDLGMSSLLQVLVTEDMLKFLEREAIDQATSEKKYTVADIVRALITNYYDKKAMGLVLGPED